MSNAPLQPISGNKRRGKELSPYLRGQIMSAREEGASFRDIAKRLEIPVSTVFTTVKSTGRQEGHSLSRTGRPSYISERDKRALLRFVRANPRATYAVVRQETGLTLCTDTIRQILYTAGISNWMVKKRPFLTARAVEIRKQWAFDHSQWKEEWKNIIFSDECSIERGVGAHRDWAFRTPSQKWNKEMIQTYKRKDISIMVWGAI
jgi:transposase